MKKFMVNGFCLNGKIGGVQNANIVLGFIQQWILQLYHTKNTGIFNFKYMINVYIIWSVTDAT